MNETLRTPGQERYKAFLEAHRRSGQLRLARAAVRKNRRRADRIEPGATAAAPRGPRD